MFLDAKNFRYLQVVDLQVFLAPRITLKPLVPSFPCFANIYVSLMEKVCDGYLLLSPFTDNLNACKSILHTEATSNCAYCFYIDCDQTLSMFKVTLLYHK